MAIVYTMQQFLGLVADEREEADASGFDRGFDAGYAQAQTDMVERLRKQLGERGPGRFDVGKPVLAEAIRRCKATVADIEPTKAVDRG
jgi:hypothetical protein